VVVLAVVLGVVAVAAIAIAILSRRRRNAALDDAATAAERAAAASSRADSADERWAAADDRAKEAEDRAKAADDRAQATEGRVQAAEERAAAAEQRVDDLVAALDARGGNEDGGAVDAHLLWSLEQSRSERTWRHSVAVGPESTSVFVDAAEPLREALQVELDAAREEVGAVVELEADLPGAITPAGCVLTLRAAQELLADVVRRAEETTLVVGADGSDLVVTIKATDEDGEPVAAPTLDLPPSAAIVAVDGGVRVRNAVVQR